MTVSKRWAKSATTVLDRLFNFSKADLRLHGLENIPDEPVIFVINHFTRMETTFLPYLLFKNTGRIILSVAHHSFFGGGFGNLLEKLGAVSTKNPERDKILISGLLSDMSVAIFPEGQMLKDKKIIEKGKYMVYNSGIRRPPHTGAARLAIKAHFYKEKIKYFKKNNLHDELNKIKETFSLTDENIEKLINTDTRIVPVNITYYPVRAKNNAILSLVERFSSKLSERFIEELEVEGTMLMEGVDVDINFGTPISVSGLIAADKKLSVQMKDRKLYLEKSVIKKELSINKISNSLMYDYMHSIYQMTTVNHDHIFASLLYMSKSQKFCECDLKNRAFLIIEDLKRILPLNLHTSILKNQFHLLTDDENDRYKSFIEAAVSDGIIRVENGFIYKNKERFSNKLYEFHTVRQDNIIEIFHNEIEPLKDILKIIKKISRIPTFIIKRKIINLFLEIDNTLFKQDYKKYYIQNESKPKEIGTPFFLRKPFSKKGIILIHGYMAAPEEIRVVADALFKMGYSVYGARLRGHGTAPEDLARREWIDWYNSVNRAFIIMNNSVNKLYIGGFSMGAGLALLQASRKNDYFNGVISVNAPLKLMNLGSHVATAVSAWNKIADKVHLKKAKFEFIDNDPENKDINYLRNPISGVSQLTKLMDAVEDNIENIKIPSLIIQGSNDPVVNPESGQNIFDRIDTSDKELHMVSADRHGIVRGKESAEVVKEMVIFMNKYL